MKKLTATACSATASCLLLEFLEILVLIMEELHNYPWLVVALVCTAFRNAIVQMQASRGRALGYWPTLRVHMYLSPSLLEWGVEALGLKMELHPLQQMLETHAENDPTPSYTKMLRIYWKWPASAESSILPDRDQPHRQEFRALFELCTCLRMEAFQVLHVDNLL